LADFCNGNTFAKCEAIADGLYIIQKNFTFHGIAIVYKEGE